MNKKWETAINKSVLEYIHTKIKGKVAKFTVGFLTGKRIDNTIFIADVMVPKQKRDYGESSVSDKEVMRTLWQAMKMNLQIVGILFYQPSFDLYLSAVNKDLMEELVESADQPMVSLVCNENSKNSLLKVFEPSKKRKR